MRITPETLHKIARDTVAQRVRSDRSLLSIYMLGSLLEEDALLGGAADIDLVFVHDDVVVEREIKSLSDDVHLDIAHHPRSEYRHARQLRLHPWLGPNIFGCKILYDPQHFMDFTQAGVRSQFNRPDNILGRARSLEEHARQMWSAMHAASGEADIAQVDLYLRAVEHAANAIASLSGPPLTERRFLQRFPARAQAVGHAGLAAGLLGLLGAPAIEIGSLSDWLPGWEAAYRAIPAQARPARLHMDRMTYYKRAFEHFLRGDQPYLGLWPLLHTWTQAVSLLPEGAAESQDWQAALVQLGLYGQAFRERVQALDAYLDTVEEALDAWARENGAE